MILILNTDAFQNDLLKSCFESICFTGFFEIFMGGGGGWGRGDDANLLYNFKTSTSSDNTKQMHHIISSKFM